MGRLQGKVALVTGGGSGFGEAISHAYVAEGANVLIGDMAVDNGNRVASDIAAKKHPGSGSAVFCEMNVTKKQAWVDALEMAKSKFGKLDIVVNNAGTTYTKQPSIDVPEDEFDKILAVNQKSIYLSVVVVMPYMVEQKSGVFLNTSSVAATRVRPGQVWYGGTKGFVSTVTQGLAAEYGPSGIRVNSICPLRGATALLEKFSGVPDSPEERARFAQSVPLRRMSEPNDVAMAAVYLASDEASFVSGVNMPVDGGRLAV